MDSIVFKVKYEDTLRRFNVAVSDDQLLDLSMECLRLKICSLFNLPPEADFHLTYKDEDNDLVTLGDDEDLHDVVRQGLDPVRITVHLHAVESAQTGDGANGSSTPSQPSLQNVQPNISPNVAEVLKSVQEPLSHLLQKLGSSSQNAWQSTDPDVAEIVKAVQETLTHALSKLSPEMSSKAASASPVLAVLFDILSKLGHFYLNASQSESGAVNLSSHNDVGNDSNSSSGGRPVEASVAEGVKNDDIDRPRSSQSAHKSTQSTEGTAPVRPPLFSSFSYDQGKNAGRDYFSDNMSCSGAGKKNKFVSEDFARNFLLSGWNWDGKMWNSAEKESNKDTAQDSRGSHFGENMARSYREPIPSVENPFSGLMSGSERFVPDQPCSYLSNRSFKKADGFSSLLHKGIRCDGCGVLPITGPRFKSKVKYDFDLCSVCFPQMGNYADYTRIDVPLHYRHSWSCKTTDPVIRLPVVNGPCMARPHGAKHHRSRLDTRFIMDINVVDGTTMPPSMPFTKIWRMRNTGTLPWTSQLQLFWIGGDRFSPSDSVEIKVPVNGVPVGNELDIAVDFIAPELPGRYISYWRMAEPSGHMFGQCVWVLIQVDASMDLTRESTPTLNLNLPPDNINQAGELELFLEADDTCPPTLEKNDKPEMGDMIFPTNFLFPSDLVCPSFAAASPSATPADYPAIPVSLTGTSVPYPIVNEISHNKSSSVPEASFSVSVINTGESSQASSNAKDDQTSLDANSTAEQASEKSRVEENLLKELKQMGFNQTNLNEEVLRMNKYDLERSVDDLCSVSEWDPILEELKEMGFEDKETNKKLLEKNSGSIPRCHGSDC